MNPQSNRFSRQELLAPREPLAGVAATVIGVGAIGEWHVIQR